MTGYIAVSINSDDPEETIDIIRRAKDIAQQHNMVANLKFEFRERPILNSSIDGLLEMSTPEPIFTIRSPLEGGTMDMTYEEKKSRYLTIIKISHQRKEGIILDNEVNNYISGLPRGLFKEIGSIHYKNTPDNMQDDFMRIAAKGSDIIKIVPTFQDHKDYGKLMQLYELDPKQSVILLGMANSEKRDTRLMSEESRKRAYQDSYLTFVSIEEGKATAPGQITLSALLDNTYRPNLV